MLVGGAPCSGKSYIISMPSEANSFRAFSCDAALRQARRRISAESTPYLLKWTSTPWNELQMQPDGVLLDEEIGSYSEHFRTVLDVLAALPDSEQVPVERTCLLPICVDQAPASGRSAIGAGAY